MAFEEIVNDHELEAVALDLVRAINRAIPITCWENQQRKNTKSLRVGPVFCVKVVVEPHEREDYGKSYDKFNSFARFWRVGAKFVITAETQPDGVFLRYELDSTWRKAEKVRIYADRELLMRHRNCLVLEQLAQI